MLNSISTNLAEVDIIIFYFQFLPNAQDFIVEEHNYRMDHTVIVEYVIITTKL